MAHEVLLKQLIEWMISKHSTNIELALNLYNKLKIFEAEKAASELNF